MVKNKLISNFLATGLFFIFTLNGDQIKPEIINRLAQIRDIVAQNMQAMYQTENLSATGIFAGYPQQITNPIEEENQIFLAIVTEIYNKNNIPIVQLAKKNITIGCNAMVSELLSLAHKKEFLLETELRNSIEKIMSNPIDINNIIEEDGDVFSEEELLAQHSQIYDACKLHYQQHMLLHSHKYSEKIRNLTFQQFTHVFIQTIDGGNYEYNENDDDEIKDYITNSFLEFMPGPLMKDTYEHILDSIDKHIKALNQ